ncbi:MAG: pantetheine-phosphate adenylyltransferase [Nitrospirota bacterium]|nr:pantetheine-phosphate adenylyltransferase [Nitrospirota bacterium]
MSPQMPRHAIYPGTFDPVTNGHLDILHRGLAVFGQVTVAVSESTAKSPMFSLDERLEMLRQALADTPRVTVLPFSGLVVEFARACGADALLRGLRAVSDFEYELQMALMNRRLADDIETVFLMPSEEYTYLSSSIVRSVATAGGEVDSLVPAGVAERLKQKKASG